MEKKKPIWRVKKLSTALKQALDDLRWVERNKKRFVVDMGYWYEPEVRKASGKCCVCLAGAHMARTVDGPHCLEPDEWDAHTEKLYYAINNLRQGDVGAALASIGKPRRVDLDRDVVSYEGDRETWWKQMKQLVRDLEKAKL